MHNEIRSILDPNGPDAALTATETATVLNHAGERRAEVLAVINSAAYADTSERRDALRVLFSETRTQPPVETAAVDHYDDSDIIEGLRAQKAREDEWRNLTAKVPASVFPAATTKPRDEGEWRTLLPSGEEFRVTQTVAVAGDGGYTAPKGVAGQYVDLLRARSAVARVLPASSIIRFATNEFVLPQIVASSSPAKVLEAAAYGEGATTFAPLTFSSVKLGEVRWASVELHNDSALDIRRLLSDDMIRSAAAKLDALCVNGVLATDGIKGLTATGNGTLTTLGAGVDVSWDHLSDAAAFIEAANGVPSAVLVSTDVYGNLRKTKDGSGAYIGDPTLSGANSAWGLTLVPSSAVPAKTAIVLDGSRVYLGIRDEVRVSIDESARWESDQIGYKVSMRVAGLAVAEATSVQVVKGA